MDALVLETTLKSGYFFFRNLMRRLPFCAKAFIYLTPIILYKREFLLSCVLSKNEFGKQMGMRLIPNNRNTVLGDIKV